MTKPVYAIAHNKHADQPAHPHSLISTFVFRCLDIIIPILAISGISGQALTGSLIGRFETYMVTNCRRQVFSCRGSFDCGKRIKRKYNIHIRYQLYHHGAFLRDGNAIGYGDIT